MKNSLYVLALFAAVACKTDETLNSPSVIIENFRQAVNTGDTEKLRTLLTDSTDFVSASGEQFQGAAQVIDWLHRVRTHTPGYALEFSHILESGGRAMAYGNLHGSRNQYGETHSVPMMWRIDVAGGRVNAWREFVQADFAMPDLTGRDSTTLAVQGLGGVFFKASDPKALSAWYGKHLGLPFGSNTYAPLKWRDRDIPYRIASTALGIFDENSDYYAPSKSEVMLNFRVNNLEALLAKLKGEGVTQVGEVVNYDYGKFAWIMDPEGHKIELWEPIDEVLEQYDRQQSQQP